VPIVVILRINNQLHIKCFELNLINGRSTQKTVLEGLTPLHYELVSQASNDWKRAKKLG
jgi:hypothetical protein